MYPLFVSILILVLVLLCVYYSLWSFVVWSVVLDVFSPRLASCRCVDKSESEVHRSLQQVLTHHPVTVGLGTTAALAVTALASVSFK